MRSPFRDANLGDLVAGKRLEVIAIEEDIPPILEALMPAPLANILRAQRSIAFEATDLTRANAALDLVAAAWEELRAREAELRVCGGDEVVSPFEEPGDKPWFYEETYDRKFRAVVDAALVAHGAPTSQRWGHRGYQGRLLVDGTMFVLTITTEAPARAQNDVYDRTYTSHLTMFLASPSTVLEVTPRGVLAKLKEALHLSHAQSTDDPNFDARFVVEGTPHAAALLTPAVRENVIQLVDMFRHDRAGLSPLTIGPNQATAAWTYTTELSDLLDGKAEVLSSKAIDVLQALRDAIRGE